MPPPSLGTTPPAWVLPPQLEYYYPSSFSTTTPPVPEFVVRRRNKSCTRFSSILFAEPSLVYVLLGSRPNGAVTLSRGWWSQNTGPAFTCNLQGRRAAHFRKHLSEVLYYCVYRQSHCSKIILLFVLRKPIEVRVGLLLKYVLRGCTVTESKCSWII